MKFQNPSLNSVLNGRKDERTDERSDERTSRKQYAPHFFKVGGIKTGNTVFSIITLRELSVAMETRVLIQSGLKPYAAFPPSQ